MVYGVCVALTHGSPDSWLVRVYDGTTFSTFTFTGNHVENNIFAIGGDKNGANFSDADHEGVYAWRRALAQSECDQAIRSR